MSTVSVRYLVHDVPSAVDFYVDHFGFDVAMFPAPGFAMLVRDDLRLLLNRPGGGGAAGATLSDGSVPQPGGWNRFQVEVPDLAAARTRMSAAGVEFRGDSIEGNGGHMALAVDPSGNLVELFEPRRG